jgi:hypothetical protein
MGKATLPSFPLTSMLFVKNFLPKMSLEREVGSLTDCEVDISEIMMFSSLLPIGDVILKHFC